MTKFLWIAGTIVGAALLLFLINVGMYSALNSSNQGVLSAKADVESTLQRRADLIPNLVATVKGYAAHEEKVFKEVTEARAKAGQINFGEAVNDPAKMKAFAEAQDGLSSALSRLMVVVENYPELKAAQGFQDLQHQLEGTENRINVARERYNAKVNVHNSNVHGYFMGSVAARNGFEEASYFKAEASSQSAPSVNF